MTVSLSHGILLMSLNDDVISGMHSPLPRDAMVERAMVVDTVQCGAHYIILWCSAVARRSLYHWYVLGQSDMVLLCMLVRVLNWHQAHA
jgi:hypothetical protein